LPGSVEVITGLVTALIKRLLLIRSLNSVQLHFC